jgi:FMN phosphatase YigB (HAD superfamily)
MAHLIFHLNVLADPASIRALTLRGMAQFLGKIYGNETKWYDAFLKIFGDWNSYHADLNFSGEDGMADMREARFRIMRALFRLAGIAEPSQEEIHRLADESLTKAHREGDIFFHDSIGVIDILSEKHSLTLVSYFPQAQLEAMVKASGVHHLIKHFIGADSFEQYEMNRRYFEMLLNHLKAKPEECLYIDKQSKVLEVASQVGLKIFAVEEPFVVARHWWEKLDNFIAKEIP